MRYALTESEWQIIQPTLPRRSRGVPRVDDRRILKVFGLRSGAAWRDLPDQYGPYTTCYNRFARWRRAGVWDRIMAGLSTAHDAAVQMIDTSVVRVHQHGSCVANSSKQHIGRSRGGLTSKIHVVVDAHGLPVRLGLTAGQVHDNRLAVVLLDHLHRDGRLLADRGYDADWIRGLVAERGAWANIPSKRKSQGPDLLQPRPLSGPQFSRAVLQQDQALSTGGTRYDKLAVNYLAFVKLACIRLWLRVYEYTRPREVVRGVLSCSRAMSAFVGMG